MALRWGVCASYNFWSCSGWPDLRKHWCLRAKDIIGRRGGANWGGVLINTICVVSRRCNGARIKIGGRTGKIVSCVLSIAKRNVSM